LFTVSFEIAVDAKGRFTFPGALRDKIPADLQGKLTITSDPQSKALNIYLPEEWSKIMAKLLEMPSTRPGIRAFQRHLMGSAQEIDFDSAGRLLLPPMLRKKIGSQRKLAIVGIGNRIEVWGLDDYEAMQEAEHALINNEETISQLDELDFGY
jgi:MraZ protein